MTQLQSAQTDIYIQGLEEQSNLDKQSNLNDLEAAKSHDLHTITEREELGSLKG